MNVCSSKSTPGTSIDEVDESKLQDKIIEATHSWSERLAEQSRKEDGDDAAARMTSLYSRAFPEAYKEDFSPRQGVADLKRLEALQGADDTLLTLYR